jgi:exonuclease III
MNKRGVGILVANNLNYAVIKEYRDTDENILGLSLKVDDFPVRIFSIYGPNFDNRTFYSKIDEFLSQDSQVAAVLGGDWNTTYSTYPAADNIDVRNMRNPPSLVRSGWLRKICNSHRLTDPFRALHPTLRDFTFIPTGARSNRSRLDFFLVYDELLPLLRGCHIKESQQIKLLDHKPVFLDFTRNKTRSRPFINRTIINNPRTDDVVLAAIYDTYLQHAADCEANSHLLTPPNVHHAIGISPLQLEKEKVGNLMRLIREYNNIDERLALDPNNRLTRLELAAKNTEILLAKTRLISFENLSLLTLSTTADTFLEVLLGNVKGHVISFQQWVKKKENSLKAKLINTLNDLKADPDPDLELIFSTEQQLLDLTDSEILEKVKTMKIFECLNAEKPTPLFMSLARCRSSAKQLSCILKDDGSNYASNAERTEGIVSYYENLYKKPIDERVDYENCIEDFLGPDIVSHPIVQNSRLTLTERENLDRPLDISELDKSMKKANLKSAPGIDGISNKFLKKYWHFFRRAVYEYCNYCFENGKLTDNFLSASIKLIPKKGDVTNLKNWRPISLLSNVYKLISRAINFRLNSVVNRICSRAQKGFNDSRFTQECLINVIETIRHCNNNNISAAVVAVDMAKAFDTLSHGYLAQVFKFFNFGPNMQKWLRLLGTKRTACIILDDNSYTRNFSLSRGSAQGDNISPDTFNFGDQILIFKIELDPEIAGVWQNFQVPQQVGNPAPPVQDPVNNPRVENDNGNELTDFFSHESARETGKNESLADDNTSILLLSSDNLRKLKRALDDFAKVSGLVCNYDKTCVLPIGPALDLDDLSGFAYSDSIKLLGLNITKDFLNTDETFTEIHEKIRGKIAFWDRFRLSLPGRISVIKNLLIPLLNYLGCILSPSDAVLDGIQESLDNFAIAGNQVSRDRRYLKPADGGLGLFDLKSFLTAQKCAWIKRSDQKTIDNWRFDLKKLAPDGKILQILPLDIPQNSNPILSNLVEAFKSFKNAHSMKDENYKKSEIFMNSCFVRSGRDNGLLDINFFTREIYARNKKEIRALTFNDCFVNDNFRTINQFEDIGLFLTGTVWLRLRGAITHAKTSFQNQAQVKNESKSVTEFFASFKKGSKKFRDTLTYDKQSSSNRPLLRTVITFAELTDTPVPTEESLGTVLGLWSRSFLPNDLRSFIFKERNNSLPLNNRTANFLQNINEACSFCRIINPETRQRESFSHLFFDCPVTRTVLNGFLRISQIRIQGNDPNLKNVFWYGIRNGTLDKDFLIIFEVFRFCIWKSKTRKKIPTALAVTEQSKDVFHTIGTIKPGIIASIQRNNLCPNFLQALG